MTASGPKARLQRLANAYQISCAVQAAASIGLGALLNEGPVSGSELSARTGLQGEGLARLMLFLQTLGIVDFLSDGRFAATELSNCLDEIDNIAEGPEALQAWAKLPTVLKSGENAFSVAHGVPFYELAAANEVKSKRWSARNCQTAARWAKPTASAIELEGTERVIDLGAGNGELLAKIAEAYPLVRLAIWELPQAIESAKLSLTELGILDRTELVAGNLTKDCPPAADVYIFCRVLLNMSDEDTLSALSLCSKRMAATSKLIIVEALMPEEPSPERLHHYAHNLHLMLVWGGKQRTQGEFSVLLESAGLQLESCKEIISREGANWHILTACLST